MPTTARTRRSPPECGSLRVLIVDDHPMMRRGIVELIGDTPGMIACGEAGSTAEALVALGQRDADVVIVDLTLGHESGIDLIHTIATRHPKVRALVLSGHDEQLYAERALKAGALGYITKDASAADIVAAIRCVAAGKAFVSQETAERILAAMGTAHRQEGVSPVDRLSDRERQVLTLMGRGLPTREIARELGRSVKTIDSHFAHIKEKLGVASGRELMRLAVTWAETDHV